MADGPGPPERACLVTSPKPAVARRVGREDRRQPSVWPLDRQGFLLEWSRPVYAFSCQGQGITKMWWRGRPMSGPVKGCRMPADDGRRSKAPTAGVRQASREETRGQEMVRPSRALDYGDLRAAGSGTPRGRRDRRTRSAA